MDYFCQFILLFNLFLLLFINSTALFNFNKRSGSQSSSTIKIFFYENIKTKFNWGCGGWAVLKRDKQLNRWSTQTWISSNMISFISVLPRDAKWQLIFTPIFLSFSFSFYWWTSFFFFSPNVSLKLLTRN